MQRTVSDACPVCHSGFNGPADEVERALARHIETTHAGGVRPVTFTVEEAQLLYLHVVNSTWDMGRMTDAEIKLSGPIFQKLRPYAPPPRVPG